MSQSESWYQFEIPPEYPFKIVNQEYYSEVGIINPWLSSKDIHKMTSSKKVTSFSVWPFDTKLVIVDGLFLYI